MTLYNNIFPKKRCEFDRDNKKYFKRHNGSESWCRFCQSNCQNSHNNKSLSLLQTVTKRFQTVKCYCQVVAKLPAQLSLVIANAFLNIIFNIRNNAQNFLEGIFISRITSQLNSSQWVSSWQGQAMIGLGSHKNRKWDKTNRLLYI